MNDTSFSMKHVMSMIQEAAGDVVTQSEIMTRAACPRKWFYRYALKLDKKAPPNYHLIYGDLIHQALANLYRSDLRSSNPTQAPMEVPKIKLPDNVVLAPGDKDEIELVRAKAQIAFDAYRWHYFKEDCFMRVLAVEQDYEIEFKGIKLQGRIDLVAHPKMRDGMFIWDFKTAGRFDASMLDAWSFRFQFLFYCWLYWKATGNKPSGTMANGLAKTLLKPSLVDRKRKIRESKEEYLHRVKDHYQANRHKYFYRQRMPLATGQLERFEKEMLMPHLVAFTTLRQQPTSPLCMAQNTGHCHVYNTFCEFLPLCKDGTMMMPEYEQRDTKHVELGEAETEIGES